MSVFWTRLLLLLMILLAFALRIFALDLQSLWYDEGVTATVAQLDFMSLTSWTARDIQPPLYYYIISAWGNLTDWREWHLRWPSVWFGTLTVPLMVALTRKISRSHTSAILVVSLLTALHPLLIYYSQEARMYAMLTALVILCGVLLLRRNWLLFILAATAAVYTHYFAFFLMLAIGVGYLLTRPKSETLKLFLAANFTVLILYIPWFGALFTRLAVDTSYLPGQVKLTELIRHALITFIAGETILESHAALPLSMLALVTLVAILWLLWQSRITLIYVVCWVLIPCALILLLTRFVPKFNARYVMIALPGLLLLWSVAAGGMFQSARIGWRLAGVVLVLLLTVNFGLSIRNWFGDDAFTKAQWREVAQHVRAHKSADEAVILVSGHTWPIWNYYASDMAAVRLPDLEILDTNATLDYVQSGIILRDALADQEGAWLVRWQDQFVDPMETAALHLESAATHQTNRAEFWQLQLEHFTDLRADQISPTPSTLSQETVNFGNQLVLIGSSTNVADELLLYWTLQDNYSNGISPLADLPDYRIAGELRTQENLPYHRLRDRRPVAYEFPTTRWRPGEINVSRIPARDWAGLGALAGDYQLALSVYNVLDESATLDLLAPSGAPLGKQALLPLSLRLPITSGNGTITGHHELSAALAAKVALSAGEAEPGEPIQADIHWLARQPLPEEKTLRIQWIGADQQFDARQPLAWPRSHADLNVVHVHTVHELRVPIDAPAGDYLLSLAVDGHGALQNGVTILPSTRSFDVPLLAQRMNATFGKEIDLLGVVESAPTDDGKVSITVAWRAADVPRIDYYATVQILDDAGQPVRQSDLALPRGSSKWLPGQVETQTFILDTPTLAAQRLIVAVYDPKNNFQRLTLPNGADNLMLR